MFAFSAPEIKKRRYGFISHYFECFVKYCVYLASTLFVIQLLRSFLLGIITSTLGFYVFVRYLNEKELQDSETVVIESTKKDNIFSLTFVGNIKNYVGVVRLVARNSGGEVFTEASLTISGRPPAFIEKPYTCQVQPGNTRRLFD